MYRHPLLLASLLVALAPTSCKTSTGAVEGPRGPLTFAAVRTGPGSGATFSAIASRKVLEAALSYPKPEVERVQEQPMALTASDGTGLKLTALKARAVVEGPLAFTELHLTFHNPEPRQREGHFTISLPQRSAISRLAMKLSDRWQEAEVVERQKARQVYEDFLHRRQDPALLEKKAGNEFSARIFPIPPSSDKEIIISYSQQLTASAEPYKLLLKGLPTMDLLDISAMVGKRQTSRAASALGGSMVSVQMIQVQKKNWAPDTDFVVDSDTGIAGLGNGALALARVKPEVATDREPMESLMLLVDTSASRAPGFYSQVEQLGALVTHLRQVYSAEVPLSVVCFDQRVDPIYGGPLGQFGKQDLEQILARRPLGASDLEGALRWVGLQQRRQRVLLVSDGVATLGKTGGADLRAAVSALGPGTQRLDVLAVGGIRDEETLKKLVRGTLTRDGVVLDGDQAPSLLADRMGRRTVSGIKVAVAGARWLWPQTLDGVQAGDEVLVYADFGDGAVPQDRPLSVTLSGPISQTQAVPLAQVKKPLLERAWVEARIAHLQQQMDSGQVDPDMSGAIKQQIIDLSVKHRVLSDFTALLVLETEWDYQRYGIARTALADILVVGQSGVELLERGGVKDQPEPQPMPITRPLPEEQPFRPRRAVLKAGSAAGAGAMPSTRPSAPKPSAERDNKRRAFDFDDDRVDGSLARPETTGAEPPSSSASGEAGPVAAADAAKEDEAESPSRGRRFSAPPPASAPEPQKSSPAPMDRVAAPAMEERRSEAPPAPLREKKKQEGPPPLEGRLAAIMDRIESGSVEDALVDAVRWRSEQPGDVMALLGLGEALEANNNLELAARAYGSIIDLFPSRADMRRFAGQRLEALGLPGLTLAADTYGEAVKQRPDHASGYHMQAMALILAGEPEKAVLALETALGQAYRIQRPGVQRILQEDLGLAAAALLAKQPNRRQELSERLARLGATLPTGPSLRFVLSWETDANDVDFHIHDGQGGHAYYSSRSLPTGGELYADVTNGYGPECFTIEGTPRAFPYQLQIHYFSRGPMGYGMGTIQVIQHDGQGGISMEPRPFVVMNDRAFVDLGLVKGPL